MILSLLVIVHLFLLSRITFFPYPELFVYPYLTNHGLIPYRDILDQHFPGLMFFPINLGNLGMTTIEAARFWQYGIVIVVHILLYLIGKKIFKTNGQALIANFFFLVWQPFFEGWVLWIDSFLPIFTLLAFYFLISKRLFWTGFFLGIALLFKQVVLPLIILVGIYMLVTEKRFKTLFYFGLGILIPILYLLFYVHRLGIWQDFFYWTATFNITTFANMGKKYGTLAEWLRVLGVYGFAALAILNKKMMNEVVIISLFIVGSLASVYARFDFVHFQPSLPFIALLSAISLIHLATSRYLKWTVGAYVIVSTVLILRFYDSNWNRSTMFFGDKERLIATKVMRLSSDKEKIFALGTTPHIYSLADRLPSGGIFVFQFPWFMAETQDRILNGIVRDQPAVVIRDKEAQVEGKNLIHFMPKIADFINENYKVIDQVSEIEIMVKK